MNKPKKPASMADKPVDPKISIMRERLAVIAKDLIHVDMTKPNATITVDALLMRDIVENFEACQKELDEAKNSAEHAFAEQEAAYESAGSMEKALKEAEEGRIGIALALKETCLKYGAADPSPMKIEWDLPTACFDLETTGTDPATARIIEIAIQTETDHKVFRVNPGVPIPKESSDVHGITDDDVRWSKKLKDVMPEIIELLKGRVIIGYNQTFYDLPLLEAEAKRCGMVFEYDKSKVLDVLKVYRAQTPHTLANALWYYCRRPHVDAHGALGDVLATTDIFRAMLQFYPDLRGPMKISEIIPLFLKASRRPNAYDEEGKIITTPDGLAVTFGKYTGWPLRRIAREDRGWLTYMAPKMDDPMVREAFMLAAAGKM